MGDDVPPKLQAALERQMDRRRATLAAGARHVGWKMGMGQRERIAGSPAIGHLTSATQVEVGSVVQAGAAGDLHADAEVAVCLGRAINAGADPVEMAAAIEGFGAALEIVDLEVPRDDPGAIVATNVFHRAFALGGLTQTALAQTPARLVVDGRVRGEAPVTEDMVEVLGTATALLASVDESLRAGDWLLTGAAVQVRVRPGDDVVADMGPLGRVGLRLGIRS